MPALKPKDVTAARVRQLDRAMSALAQGHITYKRFVAIMKRWVAGRDVSRDALGHEQLPERIQLRFGGKTVGIPEVADALGARYHNVATALSRMRVDGRVRRVSWGVYEVFSR
jgi:hypothetical protein